MQLTINSFRPLFPDKIFSLTLPWLLLKSLTFPWQLSNSPTFPGFPYKWSPWEHGSNSWKDTKSLKVNNEDALARSKWRRLIRVMWGIVCPIILWYQIIYIVLEKITPMFYTIISDMTGNDKVNGSHATSRSRWHSTASAEPANVEFLWQHWLSALLVCWMTLSSWFTMSCSSWHTPTDWQCARETASISDCTELTPATICW